MVLTGNVALESMGFKTFAFAGGHTFGKAHGNGKDTITSGLEGAWSATPTRFTIQYHDNLFGFDWVKTKSPAGATQRIPKDGQASSLVPDAHVPNLRHAPIMFTTDLVLKMDPSYSVIAKSFHEDPSKFELAFAKAWFKLTHRDIAPRARYLGKLVPKEVLIWQDPVPARNYKLIDASDIAALKQKLIHSGLSNSELVNTAWSSAATFRRTDKRGGANGARIALAPEKDWAINNPSQLAKILPSYLKIQNEFNHRHSIPSGKKASLADLIVLGGVTGIEQAAKAAGTPVKVPFTPGRTDATQEQTNLNSFSFLEPKADAFRNYYGEGNALSPTEMLIDRANALSLTVPEMTALIGGMRVLNANEGGSKNGVLTNKPGTLTNDFFVNLLDMSTKWQKSDKAEGLYEGLDRKTGQARFTATPVDLIFGSHSELRAIAEVYAANSGKQKFVRDFVAAWNKVMMLDRYDLL